MKSILFVSLKLVAVIVFIFGLGCAKKGGNSEENSPAPQTTPQAPGVVSCSEQSKVDLSVFSGLANAYNYPQGQPIDIAKVVESCQAAERSLGPQDCYMNLSQGLGYNQVSVKNHADTCRAWEAKKAQVDAVLQAQKDWQAAPPAVATDGKVSFSYVYFEIFEACSTGRQTIKGENQADFKAKICAAWADDALNNDCAKDTRTAMIEANCK